MANVYLCHRIIKYNICKKVVLYEWSDPNVGHPIKAFLLKINIYIIGWDTLDPVQAS